MKRFRLLVVFYFIGTVAITLGCSKNIGVHPSYYAATYPGGRIDKSVAVVIPTSEKYKKYTYNAWWAGWSASIELGEALEELSMQTALSLYEDVFLVRNRPDKDNVAIVFWPKITHYRHDVPDLFRRIVPHTATITIHVTAEDSDGNILLDKDYNGKDSKSMTMDVNMWPVMEELAEKVFEQTFEIIASDLRSASQ